MRLGSACSGVGCIDLGLERAGFEPAWQIEIDPTCRAVLERHWPDIERHEDLKDAARSILPRVDLIAGGTPCQGWSIAGEGLGLDDERSRIAFDFIRLADQHPNALVLFENTPHLLSRRHAEDFAVLLEGFTGTRFEIPASGRWESWGIAVGRMRACVWRVLDAQWFGVAQRRLRLFVVAGPREVCRPEILLEPEGLRGDPPPSREAGKVVTGLACGVSEGGGWRLGSDETAGGRVVVSPLTSHPGGSRLRDNEAMGNQIVTGTLLSPQHGLVPHDEALADRLVVDSVQITHRENRPNPKAGDPAPSLAATSRPLVASPLTASSAKTVDTAGKHGSGPKNVVLEDQRPRRLTPTEYERLMGLPDGHTKYRADGSEIADGPRYRMIGNGAAVPHVEWIGRRLVRHLAGEGIHD